MVVADAWPLSRVKHIRSLRTDLEAMSSGKGRDDPEICVLGRTNCGKSSLINHLLRRDEAPASSRAGKTTMIDLYMVNNKFVLADMPGYGFGRGPSTLNSRWTKQWCPLSFSYFKHTPNLRAALLLADIRWVPVEMDREMSRMLQSLGIPTLLVLTKDDRIYDKRKDSPAKGGAEDEIEGDPEWRKFLAARPSNAASVHETRAWLSSRIRARLAWPHDLPHVHYSITNSVARRHLGRWIHTILKAPDR